MHGKAKRASELAKVRLALLDEALPELQGYVARHPNDAMGFYELGMAQSVDDPAKAIESLESRGCVESGSGGGNGAGDAVLHAGQAGSGRDADLQFALSKIPYGCAGARTGSRSVRQALVALNVRATRCRFCVKPLNFRLPMRRFNCIYEPLAEAGQTDESEKLMAHFRDMNPGGGVM